MRKVGFKERLARRPFRRTRRVGITRARLPRFPYAVIFMDLGTEIRVLAVAHAKRRPGYWLDRVDK